MPYSDLLAGGTLRSCWFPTQCKRPIIGVLGLIPGQWPFTGLTAPVFGFVVLKGLVDDVFHPLLWGRAVILTSPTVATVGVSLTVPMAFTLDFFLNGIIPGLVPICGTALIVSGFVLVWWGYR
ncbi:unnamed protein product [Discosporangium mesarthrocarpum]